jgi:hypothetical protein
MGKGLVMAAVILVAYQGRIGLLCPAWVSAQAWLSWLQCMAKSLAFSVFWVKVALI